MKLKPSWGCNAAAPLELSCTSAESDSSRCRKRRNPHVSHSSVAARLIGRPTSKAQTSPLALDRCLRFECLAVGRKDPGTSTHYMAAFANLEHPGEMIVSVASALRTKPKGMRGSSEGISPEQMSLQCERDELGTGIPTRARITAFVTRARAPSAIDLVLPHALDPVVASSVRNRTSLLVCSGCRSQHSERGNEHFGDNARNFTVQSPQF